MALLVARSFAARLSIRRFTLAYSRRTLGNKIGLSGSSQFFKTVVEELKIRFIETEKEFESVIINATAKEGWRPGVKDAECFLACDPSGALVGELSGKPVCCMKITKYGDSFASGGCFIVNKEYRGKGYGRKIKDAAEEYLKQSSASSIGTISASDQHSVKMLQRREFRSLFYGATFVFHPTTAITRFPKTSGRLVQIKNIGEVNLEALFTYDTTVFGFERHAFLSKWLRVAGSFTCVAIHSKGSIVGYTVVRPTFLKDEGYRIGPLFAESEPIAEKLFKAVFEELLQQGEPVPVVCIDAPTEKASELCEKLQGKRVFDIVYMVRNDSPGACFDKWFGYTTTQLG